MAAQAPDLSTLTSSTDIFSSNYTLPQIRSLHRSLHVGVDDKATRLRTQVGSSYRDLLGTADSIVQMRGDNDAVQTLLGRMGGRCGRAVVGKKVSGLGTFVTSGASNKDSEDMALVARAKLLERCGLVVGRVLKGSISVGDAKLRRGDRLVLASKVFVLSRLLAKSFGDRSQLSEDAKIVVETAEQSLGGLRRRLLQSIRKVLERSVDAESQGDVLKALCAYSLATSSGAKDVLRHFLIVRSEAISGAFDAEESERPRSSNDVLKGLKLYTRTLLDVQALVPFKLADALAGLKKSPLLADETLKGLDGLRLDVYERWCGDEIQFYAPYIRHDDLDGAQARSTLTAWAAKGGEVLVDGLKATMERMTEFKVIIQLRTAVLQLWIRDGGKAKGFDPSDMLNSLRSAINGHMLQVLETKVNKLHLVASEVSATLDAWQDGVTDKQDNLWASRNFDNEISAGADHFLQELVSRLHGRNDPVSKAVNCFNSWKHVIDEVGQVVEQLRKQRWDNDIDEIEDEETIEERQQLLSRDDPQALQKKLEAALEKGFKELDAKLTGLWEGHVDAKNSGKMAMYIIRVLRDVRAGLPTLDSLTVKRFGLSIVPSLHKKLAETVTSAPVETFATLALTQNVLVGRALWEGSPELPTQPSPGSFRFLRNASQSMGDAGMDLWSPAAVTAAKKQITEETCRVWLDAVEALLAEGADEASRAAGGEAEDEEGKAENDEAKEAVDEKAEPADDDDDEDAQLRRDIFTQWLFDISLLRLSLEAGSQDAQGGLASLEERVYMESGLSSEARQRIARSSQAYWKKTNLLFGLLAD